MNITINDLTRDELGKLHAFLLTIYKMNKNFDINNFNIFKKGDNTWTIYINDEEANGASLDEVIQEVLGTNYINYAKLLNNNIPKAEIDDYINFHSTKSK